MTDRLVSVEFECQRCKRRVMLSVWRKLANSERACRRCGGRMVRLEVARAERSQRGSA